MPSVLEEYSQKLFATAHVHMRYRDRVLAGIPKSGDTLEYFVKMKQMSDAEKEDFIVRIKSGALTDEEKNEMKETAWCCFEKTKEGHLCLWHGNVKAMLREMFTTLGLTQKRPKYAKKGDDGKDIAGAAGGRQTFQHAVHVDPLRVVFLRDGKPLDKPDGYVDRVKHISDQSGTRSALGRHDFIDSPEMKFELKWPKDGVFSLDDIKKAMAAAQDDGLGACRSQGFGKFLVLAWE